MAFEELKPQPGKQSLAYNMKVDIMIYGGSAGCVDMHTMYYSQDGWKYMYEYNVGDKVLVYDDIEDIFFFEEPKDIIKIPCEDLYRLSGNGIDMVVSEEHCLLYKDKDDEICETMLIMSAEDISSHPENYKFFNEDGDTFIIDKISYYKTQDGFKYCFNVSTGVFLVNRNGNTFITGNSGKSRLLLLKAGALAYNDPNFEGVIFRRTTKPLSAAGGLFTEAKKLFKPLGVRIRDRDMEIYFTKSGGGNLKFTHLEHPKDGEGNHQGLQYSFIGFDELTHFEEIDHFLYLIGRLRSAAEGDSFLLATTNPDRNSWVYKWVSWYLTDDGYFDEEKLGRIRYMLIVDDSPVFADTEEELAEKYPELCWDVNKTTGEDVYIPPLTFCFIGGTIYDNPALIRNNPKYLSALKAQTKVNRARLLDGCWHAVPEGSNYFERSWLHKMDKIPLGCIEARGWDLASSEPSDVNRYPDPTASMKMLKSKEGQFILVGDYDEKTKDKNTSIMGRFWKRPGERDQYILDQAMKDGTDCTIILPVDPGAAGKTAFREMSKKFIEEGFVVKQDPTPNNKSKLKRFEPFSAAAQSGLISIVESTFSDETLEYIYKELENFDGERSSASKKDDICDATASVYSYLTTAKIIKPFKVPTIESDTKLHSYRNSIR